MPLFTIITATYNAAETLPRLLESLAIQSFRDFNVVIQDGASSDATCSTAASFKDRLPQLILNSAPDSGIYDAFNKAVQNAGSELGEWILFMGADDRLVDRTVLEDVAACVTCLDKHILFVSGYVQLVSKEGTVNPKFATPLPEAFEGLWKCMTIPHQSLWQRREIFAENSFDTSFRIAADYHLLARLWTEEGQMRRIDRVIAAYSLEGISSDKAHEKELIKEVYRVRKEVFPQKYSWLEACDERVQARIRGLLYKSAWGCRLLEAYRRTKCFLLNKKDDSTMVYGSCLICV